MWMCYVKEIEIIDLISGVQHLVQTFSNLHFDASHESVYGMGRFMSEEECSKLADKYHQGECICQEFVDGSISLQRMVDMLKTVELGNFLNRIHKFLPKHIVEQLNSEEELPNSSDDEKTNGEEIPICKTSV